MTLATPGVYVEAAPTLAPPRYGIVTAAAVAAETDPHRKSGGEYLPNVHGELGYLDPACETDYDNQFDDDAFGYQWASPINVYYGLTCKLPGLDPQIVESRVRQRLTNGESPALEAAVWAGTTAYTGDKVGLMTADTELIAGSTAVSLQAGIGALERYMWDQYGGTPVLHIGRQFYPALSEARLLDVGSRGATTPVGSTWSLGAYPNTNAAGAAAAAGTAWIVATGQVQIERFDVEMIGHTYTTDGAGLSPRTNELFVLGHRTSVVKWDGIAAAVLVNI